MEERVIDRLLFTEFQIGKIKFKAVDLIFSVCLFAFAFIIRWKLMPIESGDFQGFLENWMNQIREGGGFRSLGHQISNYTSPYMYLMCMVSYLTENNLYGLKLLSVFFDYLASIAMFLIVYQMTDSVRKSVLGMAALLLSPAVILDGAYWCQCDIIYTTFILYAFYCFLKDNSKWCMIFLGISFAFKLQALFIVPFFIIMWLKRKTICLIDFLYLPVIYMLSALPAWMAGRGFQELMMIYFEQAGTYPWGTLDYPNIYVLLGEAMPDIRHAAEVSGAGTFLAIILLGCIAYYLYEKNINLTNELIVTIALFTVAVTVYFLPHMHERYGFLIDLLAILYGILNVKKLPVVCGFMLVSILSFMPFLIAVHIVPIQYVSIGLWGLIVYVGYDFYRQVSKNQNPVRQPS